MYPSNWIHLIFLAVIKKVMLWSFDCIHICEFWKMGNYLPPEEHTIRYHQSQKVHFVCFFSFCANIMCFHFCCCVKYVFLQFLGICDFLRCCLYGKKNRQTKWRCIPFCSYSLILRDYQDRRWTICPKSLNLFKLDLWGHLQPVSLGPQVEVHPWSRQKFWWWTSHHAI